MVLASACASAASFNHSTTTEVASRIQRPSQAAPGFHDLALVDQGVERSARIYVPARLGRAEAYPVLFCLANNSSASCIEQGRWTHIADRDGVILVGIGGSGGWVEGSGRGRAAAAGIDDVGFLNRLLDSVLAQYPGDPARVYATGFSMSGGMVFRMAVDMGPRLAAVASHSSAYWLGPRRLAAPPSVMFIMGDSDENNPMDGGGINTPKRPVQETVDAWRVNLDVADRAPVTTKSNGVTRSTFGPGPSGAVFAYVLVNGLGHTWAGGDRNQDRQDGVSFNATEEIWAFFKDRSRCDLGPPVPACPR